jgi:hypothetical protein
MKHPTAVPAMVPLDSPLLTRPGAFGICEVEVELAVVVTAVVLVSMAEAVGVIVDGTTLGSELEVGAGAALDVGVEGTTPPAVSVTDNGDGSLLIDPNLMMLC